MRMRMIGREDINIKPKLGKAIICSYCPKDGSPYIDINTEEGRLARKEGDKWKCLGCQTVEYESAIIKESPNSERSQAIIQRRLSKLTKRANIDALRRSVETNDTTKSFRHIFPVSFH